MERSKKSSEFAELERLVEEITVDANGEDECFGAFQAVLEDEIEIGCGARVFGEDVVIEGWNYDGNERRGVTAKVKKVNGKVFEVAAWEVEVPMGKTGERVLAAYKQWLGLKPAKSQKKGPESRPAKSGIGKALDLAVLAVRSGALDCRVLGEDDGREVVFRAAMKGIVPGEIVRVVPERRWVYAGQESLSGEIKETRIDAGALGLKPLDIKREGSWDPREMDWGDEGPSVGEWTKMLPVHAKGKRPQYEMEQVVPGADFAEEVDPIMDANELKDNGDTKGARRILMELCRQDLRCLDAHAHLGNLVFQREPEIAVKHYEVGVRIGELSLGEGFDGVLPWGLIDNRPFMRCMHGYGIALWKLRRFKEAEGVFGRMLLMNPNDNQGARFLIDDVRKKRPWREDTEY